MNIQNVFQASDWFKVLQTTEHTQTAVMVLQPEKESSDNLSTHEKSDQVLLVMEGEVHANIGRQHTVMQKGDVCIVPAGTPHRFENKSKNRAVTFSVYSPPEYDKNEKG